MANSCSWTLARYFSWCNCTLAKTAYTYDSMLEASWLSLPESWLFRFKIPRLMLTNDLSWTAFYEASFANMFFLVFYGSFISQFSSIQTLLPISLHRSLPISLNEWQYIYNYIYICLDLSVCLCAGLCKYNYPCTHFKLPKYHQDCALNEILYSLFVLSLPPSFTFSLLTPPLFFSLFLFVQIL